MPNKIFDYFAKKIADNISATDKKRMKNFPQARDRLLNMMTRKNIITDSQIKIHGILITFFGCGKLRHGPGTYASFATIILWFGVTSVFAKFAFITPMIEMFIWLAIAAILFVYGLVFIPLYERHLGTHDHPSIVIDEAVGQIVALCLTYPFVKQYYFNNSLFLSQLIMIAHLILSFILFRFLDIIKPFFIGWIDSNIKGSLGVMLDDLVCGLTTAAINISVFLIYKNTLTKLHTLT